MDGAGSPPCRGGVEQVPAREKVAIDTALDKLRAVGPVLGFPHQRGAR
jgi:hypothetical protein